MLKLVGLDDHAGRDADRARAGWLRDRTRLYHIVRWIGRWSMIDIFMESLLGALVQFGTVDHDRARHRRPRLLRRGDPDHVRRRDASIRG